MRPILIYHKDCPDGFYSKYVFWKKYGDSIDYLALAHEPLPFKGLDLNSLKDRDIWMVDIALKRNEILYLKELSKSLVVLDHHLTAMKDLEGLDFAKFDLNLSGATLAWKYCFPDLEVPKLIKYITDRDIFTWKEPYAKEVLAYISSFDFDLESSEKLLLELEGDLSNIIKIGEFLIKDHDSLHKRLLKNKHPIGMGNYTIDAVNTSIMKSEVANLLAANKPFGATYHFDGLKYIFSLRSDKNGINVAELAEKFGGGGHYHAAGFTAGSIKL